MCADVFGHAVEAQALLTTAGLMLASATLGAAAGSGLSGRDSASAASQSQSLGRYRAHPLPVYSSVPYSCHMRTAHGMTLGPPSFWKSTAIISLIL